MFEPAASVAVTVIVAAPVPAGVIVTCAPDVATVATPVADENAPYVNASSSGSANAPATFTITQHRISSGAQRPVRERAHRAPAAGCPRRRPTCSAALRGRLAALDDRGDLISVRRAGGHARIGCTADHRVSSTSTSNARAVVAGSGCR